MHLQNLQVNFIHQGHWVKVKVTGAEMCLWVVCLQLTGSRVSICVGKLILISSKQTGECSLCGAKVLALVIFN